MIEAIADRPIFEAKIRPGYADWLHIMGSDTAPIERPLTEAGILSDIGGAEIYKLAVRELSADQRARLVEHLAQRFGETREDVERTLDDPGHGVPVLADDIIVFINAKGFI